MENLLAESVRTQLCQQVYFTC